MSEGSTRAILYALGANGGIAMAKFAAAAYSGSGAMFAEAIHSTADCANQLLLLVGMKRAKAGESDEHPMGTERVSYFYSMIVALLLFFVGGAYSAYEGVHRLLHPEPLSNAGVALAVLALSMVLEAISLRGALQEIAKQAPTLSFMQWFRQTRESELMVVAGEDIAALAGLTLAFFAVLAAWLTGNPLYDALGSLGVGVMLMLVAAAVLREVKAMIVGESAAPELRADIEQFVAAQPEVDKVFRIITLAWGNQLMIAVKARMAHTDTALQMVDAINAVEARMQLRWPQARYVFFEPDTK
jgi:cation diffusion facilitator family transporter